MPNRAETVRGYIQAMHLTWMLDMAMRQPTNMVDQFSPLISKPVIAITLM